MLGQHFSPRLGTVGLAQRLCGPAGAVAQRGHHAVGTRAVSAASPAA
jgi:hypothetical protein